MMASFLVVNGLIFDDFALTPLDPAETADVYQLRCARSTRRPPIGRPSRCSAGQGRSSSGLTALPGLHPDSAGASKIGPGSVRPGRAMPQPHSPRMKAAHGAFTGRIKAPGRVGAVRVDQRFVVG